MLPVCCTGVLHLTGRMQMLPIDRLNPHQGKKNPLQLLGHKKARHRLARPKKDWEKHTWGQNGANLQINCRKIPPRCSAVWMGKVSADNGQVRKTSQNPLQHTENGRKHAVTFTAIYQDPNLHGRDQQYFVNYIALELQNY